MTDTATSRPQGPRVCRFRSTGPRVFRFPSTGPGVCRARTLAIIAVTLAVVTPQVAYVIRALLTESTVHSIDSWDPVARLSGVGLRTGWLRKTGWSHERVFTTPTMNLATRLTGSRLPSAGCLTSRSPAFRKRCAS
jgi:hypothetical protein